MKDLQKANFDVTGNDLHLGIDFTKIDKVNRTVSGFATLDNVDQSNDVVTMEASLDAFAKARGNIREMHQPIAVGKLVDFKADDYFDPNTNKMYAGIYVTAKVSLGAETTWQKVLDGTLSGFSIGGKVIDSESQLVKDASGQSKSVRFIKAYNLGELSLVDHPCNQLANIFSITKNANDDLILKGMITETKVENVFYCKNDEVARTSDLETSDCLICQDSMNKIGWIESGDTEKLAKVVDDYILKGGVNKVPDTNEDVVTKEEDASSDAAVSETPVVEENNDVVESAPVENDVQKAIQSLQDSVNKVLKESEKLVEETADRLEKTFGEKVDAQMQVTKDELLEKYEGLETKVSAITENYEEVKKSLESIQGLQKSVDDLGETLSKTASKDSVDVEEDENKDLQKSSFGGRFLPNNFQDIGSL